MEEKIEKQIRTTIGIYKSDIRRIRKIIATQEYLKEVQLTIADAINILLNNYDGDDEK